MEDNNPRRLIGQKIPTGDPKRFSTGTKPKSRLSALIGQLSPKTSTWPSGILRPKLVIKETNSFVDSGGGPLSINAM
ncbi:Uncharacterised protein [Chlamydia trachomatis]|nr:Uncharacterised protein [Chlamydia trachomatis]